MNTSNNKANATVEPVQSHEQHLQTQALLKILAMGRQQIADGNCHDAQDVLEEIRQQYGF